MTKHGESVSISIYLYSPKNTQCKNDTAMLPLAMKTQVQLGTSVCGKRGYCLLTLRFLAGQSTGPAGAPFSDPALTAATNARDRTRANFIFCLSLVLFDTFQMFRVMATSDGGVSGTG